MSHLGTGYAESSVRPVEHIDYSFDALAQISMASDQESSKSVSGLWHLDAFELS